MTYDLPDVQDEHVTIRTRMTLHPESILEIYQEVLVNGWVVREDTTQLPLESIRAFLEQLSSRKSVMSA